jgi:hypothetical protein
MTAVEQTERENVEQQIAALSDQAIQAYSHDRVCKGEACMEKKK